MGAVGRCSQVAAVKGGEVERVVVMVVTGSGGWWWK